MHKPLTIDTKIRFQRPRDGRKKLEEAPASTPAVPPKAEPREARLMALAIHFDHLIRDSTYGPMNARRFENLPRIQRTSLNGAGSGGFLHAARSSLRLTSTISWTVTPRFGRVAGASGCSRGTEVRSETREAR